MLLRIILFILFCIATFGTLSAKDIYVPINQVPDYFPKHITIDNKKAKADFKEYIADIFIDPEKNTYIAPLPKKNIITIIPKKTALLVLYYHNQSKKTRQFVYRHENITLPKKNISYQISPSKDEFYVSSLGFLNSYAFWNSDQVSHAYDLLSDPHKGIIALFGHILTDITHKLCGAQEIKADLLATLEQQKISCDNILHYYKKRSPEQMNIFNTELQKEKEKLSYIFECSQGQRSMQHCKNVTQTIRDITLNLITIRNIVLK